MARPNRFGEIVAAAAKVFNEKGFDAARLDDIAREVGIWKGSLYHYIESKEDLLFEVVREPSERILAGAHELAEADLPADEKLRRLCRMHVDVLVENRPFAGVYVEEIAGKHRFPDWEAKDREYVTIVEAVVAELAGSRHAEAGVAARALIGSLNWMTRWYRPEGKIGVAEVAEQIADLFLSGVRGAADEPAV
jgi:AcrR family transcriptional regulator